MAIIAVSIEKDKTSWLTAIGQEELGNDTLQFRLLTSKNNPHPLDVLFDLVSIPRYVVITKYGHILIHKTDFTPSEKEFEKEILDATQLN